MPVTVADWRIASPQSRLGLSANHAAERLSELTRRETEVVYLHADGLQPRNIAARLGLNHELTISAGGVTAR